MGKLKIYIALFVLLVGLLLLIEGNKPKPIDWTPSFSEAHKKPWGTYIVHKELAALFPEATLEDVKETPYEKFYLKEEKNINTTYLFIDKNEEIDQESVEELLEFAFNGNKVFVASQSFPYYLLDSLQVKIDIETGYNYFNDTLKKPLYLTNNKLKGKYEYDKGFEHYYFENFDSSTTQVLGFHSFEHKEYVNYISVAYGDGKFFLHTQPYAFTNYHMLKENHADYVSKAFSYLDNEMIFWNSKSSTAYNEIDSPLRFILSEPSLRSAWRLGIVGLLLFVIFMAKRRQRIVPVKKELTNTSVAFAKTIGNLYYQEGEPKDLITKKITFFLEHIRKTYLLDTQNLDENFKKRLHQKTGISKQEIDKLIAYIIFLINKKEVHEVSLITLNKMIDAFYEKGF